MALNICKNLFFISLIILYILSANYNIISIIHKTYNIYNNNNNNNLLPSPYNQIAIRNNNNNKVAIIDSGLYITKKLNITIAFNNNNFINYNNNNSNQIFTPHHFNKDEPVSLLLAKEIIEVNNCTMFPSFPCYALGARDSILKELNSLSASGYQRVEIFIDVNYGDGYNCGYQFNLPFDIVLRALYNFFNCLNEIILNLNLVNINNNNDGQVEIIGYSNLNGQNNSLFDVLYSILDNLNSTFNHLYIEIRENNKLKLNIH